MSTRLDDVVKQAAELSDRIASAEAKIEEMKDQYNKLVRDVIPDIMAEIGIDKGKTGDGHSVSLSLSVHASISNASAFKWLDDNGFSGLIKTQCSLDFPRDRREEANYVVQRLTEMGYATELKETVHPMTLKSWAKERIENSEPIPSDFFTVHFFNEAKIKKGKGNGREESN